MNKLEINPNNIIQILKEGKFCSRCKDFKFYKDFYTHKGKCDGYHYVCKKCLEVERLRKKGPSRKAILKENISLEEKLNYAWAAGFLEGEGCFTLSGAKQSKNFLFRICHITAAQNKIEPLEKLESIFGGKIGKMTDRAYQWYINDKIKIQETIPYLLPYLLSKKREAEIVLEYASLEGGSGKSYSSDGERKREKLINELIEIRERNKKSL